MHSPPDVRASASGSTTWRMMTKPAPHSSNSNRFRIVSSYIGTRIGIQRESRTALTDDTITILLDSRFLIGKFSQIRWP
jgi:hypothetical protein